MTEYRQIVYIPTVCAYTVRNYVQVLSVDWNEAIRMLQGAVVDDERTVNEKEGLLQSRIPC